MQPKDSDRLQILRRRAFFVSSALTALGCNTPGRPAEAQPLSTPPITEPDAGGVDVPEVGPAPSASSSADPRPEDDPDLATPAGVSEAASEHYASLRASVLSIRSQIDALGDSLPDACKITDQACDLQWRKLAEELLGIDRSIRRLPPRCGGSSADAKAYFEHRDRVTEHLRERLAALSKRISALVGTAQEKQRWETHQRDAVEARPEPCLKFACTDW